jgi:peroxiredoxin
MSKKTLQLMKPVAALAAVVLLGLLLSPKITSAQTGSLAPGSAAPGFNLKNVDGQMVALSTFAGKKAVVVVFASNYCPYSQAYQNRLISLQKEYGSQGVQFVLINSNDAKKQPQDSYENMQTRAKEKSYPFPYLRDESQQVAKDYGANRTPEAFLIVGDHVVYRGRIDDNTEENQVKVRDLKNGLDLVLAGTPDKIDPKQTKAFGCTIKWK